MDDNTEKKCISREVVPDTEGLYILLETYDDGTRGLVVHPNVFKRLAERWAAGELNLPILTQLSEEVV